MNSFKLVINNQMIKEILLPFVIVMLVTIAIITITIILTNKEIKGSELNEKNK